jgi:hypothetical protein
MKRTTLLTLTGLAFTLTLALTPATLFAQSAAAGDTNAAPANPAMALPSSAVPAADQWRFTVAPLLWAAEINGNVTLRGNTADINVNPGKLLQHTEAAMMVYLEVDKDKFGWYAQPNYMKLGASGNGSGEITQHFNFSDTLKIWIVESAFTYQLVQTEEKNPLTLDAYAGVRYWNVYNNLTIRDNLGTILGNPSGTIQLTDPIIGLRMQKYLTDKFSVGLRGDVGGFGIAEHSSEFSWQAVGMLGYDFTKNFTLNAGYRALGIQKENGSGASQNGANLNFFGAIVALNFHW